MKEGGYCEDLLPQHNFPGTKRDVLVFVGVVAYSVMGLSSLLFILYAKQRARAAESERERSPVAGTGSEGKVQSILFFTFEYLLYLQALVSLFTAAVISRVPIDPGDANNSFVSLMYAIVWASQHAIIEGLAILLQQNGCGRYALRKSFYLNLFWFAICFVLYYVFFAGGSIAFITQGLIDIVLFCYYGALFFLPQSILYRRPSLLLYSKYWFLFRIVSTTLHFGFIIPSTDRHCQCIYYFFRIILFSFFQPILSYHVLLIDSAWWQGHFTSHSLPTNDSPYSEDSTIEFSLASAQSLAQVMDQLNSRDKILFLNYYSIEFETDSNSFLGDGSFSKVVKGKYKNEIVAIKTIYTNDLTLEIIQKIAAEAKILSLLKPSQHVVSIYGLLLSPPSICLVLEYCSYGSLHNILRGYEQKTEETDEETGYRTKIYIPPLAITVPEMLFLSLGAVKGVHAVHSFNSHLCHRDIKSFNFLVDSNLIVKIADLELGDENTNSTNGFHSGLIWPCDCMDPKRSVQHSRSASHSRTRGSLPARLLGDVVANDSNSLPLVDPSVIHMQATWLAPETLRTGAFTQASDIYALGLVLWEIRTKQIPFSHCQGFQVQIRKCILSGYQEPFPLIHEKDIYRELLREFDDLIAQCWHQDPKKRLKSSEVVQRLETLVASCGMKSLRAAHLDEKGRTRPERLEKNSSGIVSESQRLSLTQNLLESHGGEWLLLSPTPPHQILYRTKAWNELILSRLPIHSKQLFEENGITLFDWLLSVQSEELNDSLIQFVQLSSSKFISSCKREGYGNLVLQKIRSSSSNGSSPSITLMLHGYLMEETIEPSAPIAVLFSSLNSKRSGSLSRDIPVERSRSNTWNQLSSSLLGKTKTAVTRSSFSPGSSLTPCEEIVQNEILKSYTPKSFESIDEL